MKIFLSIALVLLSCGSYAQTLSQVTFSYNGELAYYTLITDQGVLIRITPDGKAIEYGTEERSGRSSDYYNPQLMPYIGRMDYYGQEADSAYRGKVRSVGTCALKYYGNYEVTTKVGKLRSVGRINLDYNDNFGEESLKGKLKNIGNESLSYYSSTSDAAYKGRLRSIGNTVITYFSSFDDKNIKGKIKSIGSVNYAWYTSFDVNKSGLKSGLYRREITGVTYIIR
jgi:hypothetical protein